MIALPFLTGFGLSYHNDVDASDTAGKDQMSDKSLVNVGDRKIDDHRSYVDEDATLHYTSNPTISPHFTFTITDSEVADTGNSSYSLPTNFTPSMSQSATPTNNQSESSGIDLTSIIVPVAGIAAVGAVAYLILGNDKVKKTVEKKVTK